MVTQIENLRRRSRVALLTAALLSAADAPVPRPGSPAVPRLSERWFLPSPAHDRDEDGAPDEVDNCQARPNPDQANADHDCLGDACDEDDDGDGIADPDDLCPALASPFVGDEDGDAVGDACDVCPDSFDPLQEDRGELLAGATPDGVGDACDPSPSQGGERRDLLYPWIPPETADHFAVVSYQLRLGAPKDVVRLATELRVPAAVLVRDNGLRADIPVAAGTTLLVNEAHLVGTRLWHGIVINIPSRLLMLFDDGALVLAAPVGLGRIRGHADEDWRTRTGSFQITRKLVSPIWLVPASIRAEMARLGKPVLRRVEPGPDNPLGSFALQTSGAGPLLHETPARDSVFGFTSHGCARLRPEDMQRVFARVGVGTPVIVEYRTVVVQVSDEPRVYLEVHADPYERAAGAALDALRGLAAHGGGVRWERVLEAIERHQGVPVDVSASCPAPLPPRPGGDAAGT